MKIVKIFNRRKIQGGEDSVVKGITDLLIQRGEYVYSWHRSNSELGDGLSGKMKAFIWGIYSTSAARAMAGIIKQENPDVVHAHNLFPLFSPSVTAVCRRNRIPVVYHCHSYLLTCPTTFHFQKGKLCERCMGGREYWCILKNCRANIFESIAYALRNAIARRLRLFSDNVTFLIALSEFAKRRLVNAGFRESQIVVLPNMVRVPERAIDSADGEYVAFSGRFSPEKGMDTLLMASTLLPHLSVRLAGDGPLLSKLIAKAPQNVSFVGWLNRIQLASFYEKARFVVVPSIWSEVFGMVAIEAMSYGLPVVASRLGGLAEIVKDGITGLLFNPGDPDDLAEKMKMLWQDKELCSRMGMAARERVILEYSEDVYYKRLMAVYKKAIDINKETERGCNRRTTTNCII